MQEFLTERLRLRGWRKQDAASLAAMNADPEVMRHIGSGVRSYEKALAEAAAFVAADREETRGLWVIEDRRGATGARTRFHGWAALMPFPDSAEIEVGYRLARASWGRGIAAEAAGRLIAHGFGARGLKRIVAVAAPGNLRSQRVLEKLGLSFVEERTAYGVPGSWYYQITRADWEDRAL